MRSWPEPKLAAQQTEPPRCTQAHFYVLFIYSPFLTGESFPPSKSTLFYPSHLHSSLTKTLCSRRAKCSTDNLLFSPFPLPSSPFRPSFKSLLTHYHSNAYSIHTPSLLLMDLIIYNCLVIGSWSSPQDWELLGVNACVVHAFLCVPPEHLAQPLALSKMSIKICWPFDQIIRTSDSL